MARHNNLYHFWKHLFPKPEEDGPIISLPLLPSLVTSVCSGYPWMEFLRCPDQGQELDQWPLWDPSNSAYSMILWNRSDKDECGAFSERMELIFHFKLFQGVLLSLLLSSPSHPAWKCLNQYQIWNNVVMCTWIKVLYGVVEHTVGSTRLLWHSDFLRNSLQVT